LPQWQLLPVQQTFVAGATAATSASDYSLLLSTAATDPEAVARLAELAAQEVCQRWTTYEEMAARGPERFPAADGSASWT